MTRGVVAVVAAIVATGPLTGQSIADRVRAVGDGQARFSFAARPGVCGNGEQWYHEYREGTDDWESDCEAGLVRVVVTRTDGATTNVRWYVGGRWRPRAGAVDLGVVPARGAGEYLIGVFEDRDDDQGRRALTAAGLADADRLWMPVAALARDGARSDRSRRAAIEWLAVHAGRMLGTGESDREDGVRRQAIFALSQLPKDEAVPRLVRIVETHADAPVRRHALFWLGQTGDPRALPVIERILRRG